MGGSEGNHIPQPGAQSQGPPQSFRLRIISPEPAESIKTAEPSCQSVVGMKTRRMLFNTPTAIAPADPHTISWAQRRRTPQTNKHTPMASGTMHNPMPGDALDKKKLPPKRPQP